MLNTSQLHQLKGFSQFYKGEIDIIEDLMEDAQSGKEGGFQKFNLAMVVYHLRLAVNYLEKTHKGDSLPLFKEDRNSTTSDNLRRAFAYHEDDFDIEDAFTEDVVWVMPEKHTQELTPFIKDISDPRLLVGARIYDRHDEEWEIIKKSEHNIDIRMVEGLATRYSVGMITLNKWRFAPWKDHGFINEVIFDILKDVPDEEIHRAGFLGWLSAEVVKDMKMVDDPLSIIKEVQDVVLSDDFEDKLKEIKETGLDKIAI